MLVLNYGGGCGKPRGRPWCWGALSTPCSGLISISAKPLSCRANTKSGTVPASRFPSSSSPCLPKPISPCREQQPQATRSEQTHRLFSQKCTSVAVVAAHQPLWRTRETKQHRNQTTVTKIASVNGWGPCYNAADEVLLPSRGKHFWLL